MSQYVASMMNYKCHVVVNWGTLRLATVVGDLIILIYQAVLIIRVSQIFCVYRNTR